MTILHERSHIALYGLVVGWSPSRELDEALADVIAYAVLLTQGNKLYVEHSYRATNQHGKVSVSLDKVFACLHLAQHLAISTEEESS